MLSATDKLHKLYAVESGPMVWARSTGLEMINEMPSIKMALMGQAGADDGQRTKSWTAGAVDAVAKALEGGKVAADFIQSRLKAEIQSRAK